MIDGPDILAGNNSNPNLLRSCSGCTTDRKLILVTTQIVISLSVISFSAYQLVTQLDCHSQNMYSGLLSLVIGFWLSSSQNL